MSIIRQLSKCDRNKVQENESPQIEPEIDPIHEATSKYRYLIRLIIFWVKFCIGFKIPSHFIAILHCFMRQFSFVYIFIDYLFYIFLNFFNIYCFYRLFTSTIRTRTW